jgi:putative ABC transport system permease protein
MSALDEALQPLGLVSQANSSNLSDTVATMDALAALLTVTLVAVAGLGVLTTVILDTRERVHDFGVFKALGMTPRQTILMILTSVSGIGLVAGAIGVPTGIALHGAILPIMGHAAGTEIPAADTAVYDLPVVAPLLLGGLSIAAIGALFPARWATRSVTADALRTE